MENPSYAQIAALYKKYDMYDNIVKHSMQVARVAKFLAEAVAKHGVDLPVDEIEKAALLHDIAKTKCLKEKIPGHHQVGSDILEAEGFPELAKYAFNHTYSFILDPDGEERWRVLPLKYKLLIMGDARVRNFTIVSLQDRFAYLRERYPDQLPRFAISERLIGTLYDEIAARYEIDMTFPTLEKEFKEYLFKV